MEANQFSCGLPELPNDGGIVDCNGNYIPGKINIENNECLR